jgi:hypothetical protein
MIGMVDDVNPSTLEITQSQSAKRTWLIANSEKLIVESIYQIAS